MATRAAGSRPSPPPPPPTPDEIVLLARTPAAPLPSAETYAALLSHLRSPSQAPGLPLYLSSLLSLASRTPPSPSLSSFLSSLLLSFLRLYRSRHLPRDHADASRLFHLFSLHLPSLDVRQLCSVLDFVVSDLAVLSDPDDALPLDLLPRCLDLAVAAGGEGRAMVDAALGNILEAEWSKAALVKMVALLGDFPAPARIRAPELLDKVFEGLKEVDVQDLPSVAYQLLLLASKGFSRKMVVGGILAFFGSGLARGTATVMRQVEAIVLMHFNFAVKQDQFLGQEVLRILRTNGGILNHFAVGVILSVARVRRLGEGAIGLLRSVIVAAHRDVRFASECEWLPKSAREESLSTAKCIEKSLIRAINDNCGREYILPSSVQLGFLLLEYVDNEGCVVPGELMSVQELGIQILKAIFEIHDMARNEIIEQCKNRILSLKPQESSSIIKLLSTFIQSYPHAMLEQVEKLKELLDYFTFMHEKPGHALIAALLPIIKFSHDLQDYTVLVVRKAMFRREDGIRLAATDAIINLIMADAGSKQKNLHSVQESSSQASCSQQVDAPCRIGAGLFYELNGLLKRCLSQQAKVKELIYWGLVKLILLEPPVAGAVFDFLWPHFLQFYNKDTDVPLKLDSCIREDSSKACLGEPLDCLIACVSWILLLQPLDNPDLSENSWACFGFSISQDNQSGRISSRECFSNALKKIRQAMIYDKIKGVLVLSKETTSSSIPGEKRNHYLHVLSGVVVVFVNVAATELEKATEAEKVILEEEIINLAILYNTFDKELHRAKEDGFKRVPTKTFSLDISKADFKINESSSVHPIKRFFLSTLSIHRLLMVTLKLVTACISNGHPISQNEHQSAASACNLNRSTDLILFVLKSCLHHFNSIPFLENDGTLKTLISGDVKVLGWPLMQLIQLLKVRTKLEGSQKKEMKGRKVQDNRENPLYLSLICLDSIFKHCLQKANFFELIEVLVAKASQEWNFEMAADTCPEASWERNLDVQHSGNVDKFLEIWLKPLYSEFLASSLFPELEILSGMVLMFSRQLPSNSKDFHGVWAMNICRCTMIKEPRSASSIISIAIRLRLPPSDVAIAQEMASELLSVIGSEDTDPVEKSETYPVINNLTVSTVAYSLLQLADSVIAELDWAVTKLRVSSIGNHIIIDSSKDCELEERAPGLILEEAIYSRSEALVNVLSRFAKMNLKDSQAEQLLRLATKFYKLLARATKLQIAPKGYRQLLPGPRFQKLAETTCKRLTIPLYNFVALMQQSQQENARIRGLSSRIKRESRWIPDMIFQIEDYEKYLIRLSRSTKVNLLRHAKRSTARDFKILDAKQNGRQEEEVLENHTTASTSSQGEGSENSEDDNNDDDDAAHMNLPTNAEASESEDAGEEITVRAKRAKMSNVVQDSEED